MDHPNTSIDGRVTQVSQLLKVTVMPDWTVHAYSTISLGAAFLRWVSGGEASACQQVIF